VMHWITGRRFRYVTIDPRKSGYVGYVVPYNLGGSRRLNTEQECRDEMARAAAGYIADNYFSHRPPVADHLLEVMFSQNSNAYRNDQDLAKFTFVGTAMDQELLVDILPGQKGPRSWIPIWREAEAKLLEVWPAVKAIATMLEYRRTIKGPEVFAMADAAMR